MPEKPFRTNGDGVPRFYSVRMFEAVVIAEIAGVRAVAGNQWMGHE